MEIHCQERYDAMLKYAESIGEKSLQECFDRLRGWEESAKECGVVKVIHIFTDYEEHSFFFREVYENGSEGICGGILYHGMPGERDNSMSVCIDGRAYGWRIHT